MDIQKFIYWESASQDTIDFKKVYVDMTEDLISGLLLSQIVYWHLPSKETGQSKLRVEKEGYLWLAKSRDDWHDEIRISPKQFDRAIKILENKDLVVTKIFKFNSSPMKHIRLNWGHFLAFLEHQVELNALQKMEHDAYSHLVFPQRGISNLPKGENQSEPYSPMVFPQRVKSILPKGQNGYSPKGKMDIDQRGISLTENTDKEFKTENIKSINQSEDRLEALEIICDEVLGTDSQDDRWIDVFSIWERFKKYINLDDYKRILIRVEKQCHLNKVKNYYDYLESSTTKFIMGKLPPVKESRWTKKQVRTETIPDWFEESETPKTEARIDDRDIEAKKKAIEEKLKAFRK